ncbi:MULTISPECIES: hypothetical protein [unclassified Saccharibacter]|uniref:hypothetical protein n=1 Tax=unclassified Saccharibacter TaxID=2648722 RepID=UPI001326F887|nr:MULTISPECIES: hypothetical protein [unclassified Saccharibacter]MXV35876.1 hypothetical protein [Saccharibacter sp. EH611]MXV57996.1 hypothetical protein [Saccharibacter sp. EH70]MXV66391.1 hypothetical protein [Saccharibacter sp. EH60]
MNDQYLTRAEGIEIKADIKAVEADMAVVKSHQAAQQQTLEQILSQVQRGNSWRSMFIAGGIAGAEAIVAVLLKIYHIGV